MSNLELNPTLQSRKTPKISPFYTKKASKRRNDSYWLTNDGDAKIKKIFFRKNFKKSKKIAKRQPRFPRFNIGGGGTGYNIPP